MEDSLLTQDQADRLTKSIKHFKEKYIPVLHKNNRGKIRVRNTEFICD